MKIFFEKCYLVVMCCWFWGGWCGRRGWCHMLVCILLTSSRKMRSNRPEHNGNQFNHVALLTKTISFVNKALMYGHGFCLEHLMRKLVELPMS